jgi:hypothetical protein
MAIKVKTTAAGNGPATGMQKTPAPTRPAAPDEVTAIRAPTRAGYGMNGDTSRSNTNPGEQNKSILARNMEASVDDDGALERITRQGTARVDDSISGQLRTIAKGNVPDHPAMKSPNKVGAGTYDFDSLPAKLGAQSDDSASRRNAMLKTDGE